MGLSAKHFSKRVLIELLPFELAEFNGDKLAYFLAMLQEELAEGYVAQYGKGYSTILIYKKEAEGPIPEKQLKLGPSFNLYRNREADFKSVSLMIPKVLLKTRASEHILVVIKKTRPVAHCNGTIISLLDNQIAKWNSLTNQFEIYEYKSWNKVGMRYRSER